MITKLHYLAVIFYAFVLISCGSDKAATSDVKLVGHWKLQGDVKDYSGMGNDGINHDVNLSQNDAATFNGTNAYVEVPNSESLNTGKGDFSMSAWIKVDPLVRVGGDIINKFDVDSRKGVNFHILSSSSAYNGPCDARNIFFGIDDAKEGEWIDCGSPLATNSLITALIVSKNQLYAFVAGATDPKKAKAMYRYEGDGKWADCGMPVNDPNTQSAQSAILHNGEIYVGTGKWDYKEQDNAGTAAGVYKYLGGTNWEEYGKYPAGKKRIHSMSSYKGTLYVNDDQGETYSYDTATKSWKMEFKKSIYKFIASGVFDNDLYNGSSNTIFRLDKNGKWDTVGNFDRLYINQTHTFETYQGQLYIGTWPNGYIMRYAGDTSWVNCGMVGPDEMTTHEATIPGVPMRKNEIMELAVYNGKMYAGVIPKAEVWRYDGEQKSKLIKRLVNNNEYTVNFHETWCRVPAMAIFQGRLFAGTGSSRGVPSDSISIETGRVFSWETGQCATLDDDIGTAWKLVTAVREKGELKIYLDGKLVSTSKAKDQSSLDLNNTKPLLIGFGTQNYFKGSMKDVRVYSGALSESAISDLFTASK